MNRNEWLERMRASMVSAFSIFASSSEGGSLFEREGLLAAVIPAQPERSVFNSVVYDRVEALDAALDKLAVAYEAAGVEAWTVWVPEDDGEAQAMLADAGHKLDASPRAMGMQLSGFEPPPVEGFKWELVSDLSEAGPVNDRAYGYAEGTFEAGMGSSSATAPGVSLYLARAGGAPVSTVMIVDQDGDAGVFLVATEEKARGKGISSALLGQALVDARDRGLKTTTLQATKDGAPVYKGLGYQDFGAIEMWERRG